MKNSVVIVIPIHSECPSEFELISFQQCYKILYNYSIKIIAPQGLNLKEYRKYVPNIDVLYIPPKWQSSIEMYNKLKLSKYFYSLFKEFNFLLTYELDAFVFKDDFRIIQESFNGFNIDRGILKCSKNDNFELILINCYRTQSDQKTHRVIHRLTRYKNYKYVDENEVKNLIT